MSNQLTDGTDAPQEPDPLEGSKAIAATVIAAGGSYTDAGAASGRTKRTIVRWAADPVFARRVSDLRQERLSEVTGRLTEMAPRAIDVWIEGLDHEKDWVRLRAADAILEWTLRLRRAADLEVRMLEVERRQGIRLTDPVADDGDTGEVVGS